MNSTDSGSGAPAGGADAQATTDRGSSSEQRTTGRYTLVSPCRNEAAHLEKSIRSVLAQTAPPAHWIIVDDGSTDETPQILARFAAENDFISIVTRPDRGKREVGPGVVATFREGYAHVDPDAEFIVKLDLDLVLPPRYFEILLERMDAEPLLATCSGKSYVRRGGVLVDENHGDETSLGMTKFYRHDAYRATGGFVSGVMWDGIDCHRCRMLGLIARSWDEPELRFEHLRPMGSSQVGIMTGRARHGAGQYFMGTPFWYLAVSAISRWKEPPVVRGSMMMMWGWLRSALRRQPRYDDLEFRSFLRRYQRLALLRGKTAAAEQVRLEAIARRA